MSAEIDAMVRLVQEGYDPRSVVESTLSFHPGSSVKVNKATTGTDPVSGASLSVAAGTLVTIEGVGGGPSGADHNVRLPDGRRAVIPHADLGEGAPVLSSEIAEGITGAVAKISLTKPLPQSATDWVGGGYVDYGVELPDTPSADSSSSVTFLMKADDQDVLDAAVEALKKVAGVSFKSAAAATMTDWNGTP